MWIFKNKTLPPPPKPFYIKQPIATVAVILTMIGMFVLGPIGYLWNGMAEELKKKVDNQTLQLMIQKDREALMRQSEALKEKERIDQQQDTAIIENQKTLILYQQALKMSKTIIQPKNVELNKKPIPPELFVKFLKLDAEVQVKYKKYLEHKGYDISGL